jgi:Ca2+-binding RTX toxin-like protein
MAKQRIAGTTGNDTIDLTRARLDPRFDGFEVFAGNGADHVIGSAAHDILRGESGDDTLEGGKGDDVLLGGTGNDKLDGGEGIDTASYQGQSGFVSVDLNSGVGTVTSFVPGLFPSFAVEQDKLVNIENVTAGDGGSRLVGNALNNVLTGGRGSDTLIGGAGNDTLIGGEGVDTASYAGVAGYIDVNLVEGIARIPALQDIPSVEQDTLTGIENVIAGSGGSHIVGNDADNRLTGGNGADHLEGGIGNDALLGGADDDTLQGGANDDVLLGGTGNDIIEGGAGIDTVSYAGQSGFVTVDLQPGSFHDWYGSPYYDTGTVTVDGVVTEQDSLNGIENVTAGDGASSIRGDVRANVLTGGAGQDTLDGSRGGDTLLGGGGDDVLSGGRDGDVDVLTGGTGSDTFVHAAYQFPDPNADHVTDFEVERDLLDVSEIFHMFGLPEMSAADAIAQGYLVIAASGADTTIGFDPDGNGAAYQADAALFVLEAVDSSSIQAQHFLM